MKNKMSKTGEFLKNRVSAVKRFLFAYFAFVHISLVLFIIMTKIAFTGSGNLEGKGFLITMIRSYSQWVDDMSEPLQRLS